MASRRKEALTDETTLSQGLRRNLQLEGIANFASSTGLTIDQLLLDARDTHLATEDKYFSQPALEGATGPLDILKRTLSVRSVLSTDSSFAERMEALRNANPKELKLTEIGRGSFGTVYEIPGTEWCLKKSLTSPQILWMEFINGKNTSDGVNNRALNAILKSEDFHNALMPRVPRYLCSYGMADAESTVKWFNSNGHMFPVENGGKKPGPVICLERIMPLPKLVRENLIRHYFIPEKQAEALADEKNKTCICRPYLGCTSQEIAKDKRERECETLRNFPLYLDLLKQLEMDPFTIARDMALGLAAGHWAPNINMLDVEYVIGSRPYMQTPEIAPLSKADAKAAASKSTRRVRNMVADQAHPAKRPSFRNRAIQLWMIDFNKVTTFDASVGKDYRRNIQQLVSDTRATDGPYYPRVLARTEEEWKLWLEFARTYIRASKTILSETIELAEAVGLTHQKKQEELVLKRPSHVINGWMGAEAAEYGVSYKQFMDNLKKNRWEMP